MTTPKDPTPTSGSTRAKAESRTPEARGVAAPHPGRLEDTQAAAPATPVTPAKAVKAAKPAKTPKGAGQDEAGAGSAVTNSEGSSTLGRARTAVAEAGRSAGRGAGTIGRTVADKTVSSGSGAARALGRAKARPEESGDLGTVAGLSLRLPLASASIRLPGPGAVAKLGPVQVTLPTGALYYGGLVALVVGGTLELPIAAGAAVAGAVLGRRWLGRTTPTVTAFDSPPQSGPNGASVAPTVRT